MIVCINAFLNPLSPCYLVYCRSDCLLHKTHAGMNILYYHIEPFFKKKIAIEWMLGDNYHILD
jgi:hypothetical protein